MSQHVPYRKLHSPETDTMAQTEAPAYARVLDLVSDIATGRHALSKFIPPLLWLVDAVLCGLIVWKVPCEQPQSRIQTDGERPTYARNAQTPR